MQKVFICNLLAQELPSDYLMITRDRHPL